MGKRMDEKKRLAVLALILSEPGLSTYALGIRLGVSHNTIANALISLEEDGVFCYQDGACIFFSHTVGEKGEALVRAAKALLTSRQTYITI
ncbi:hypothetical protein D6833_13915 [Candidatus Parcubacteria bacterium]|nr:MAG: hypothetical protein D6833_13915 [Candidatus Parcubacteria bacterium]